MSLSNVARWAVRGLGADARRIAVTGLLAALLALGLPLATGLLFEAVVPFGDRAGMVEIVGGLVAAALASAAFQVVQAAAVQRIEARIDGRLQAAAVERLLRLPAQFFRRYTVGELADRALTRIVVAHRLSTVRSVDRVFVLEHGRVVESGAPDVLLAQDGAFARLARRQML